MAVQEFDYSLAMTDENRDDFQSIPDGTALAEDLLARCKTLLNELEAFRAFVEERRTEQEPVVDIRRFHTSVGTELKSLQKVPDPMLATTFKVLMSIASRSRPHRRENYPHTTLLQPSFLLCNMGDGQTQQRFGDVQQTILLGSPPNTKF